MGGEGEEAAAAVEDDADSESSNDSDEEEATKGGKKAQDSEGDLSDSEDEGIPKQSHHRREVGADGLNAPHMDIPRVDDIPIVSKLAKIT